MDLLSVILIGIGLAMDCFAVSTAKGIASKKSMWGWAAIMAVLFGLFQGGMPLIGFFAGSIFSDFFSRFSPWIALALLAYIGGKMIWESLHEDEQDEAENDSLVATFSVKELIILAIATSIDALATGVIFIPCPERIWLGVSIIALISFLASLVGYAIGIVFGKRFTFNVELLGGIILICIGLKIWAEGLFF
ncbi:MAG: manganese efflux pump MntP family protein [Paludibacteraceae bacterium]|nr:manganese efflux pump MntP family protein [Paludibacteraceae bacterium]